jgi:hypothetical protein
VTTMPLEVDPVILGQEPASSRRRIPAIYHRRRHLDELARLAAEEEQGAGERTHAHRRFGHARQSVDRFPHIGRTRPDEDLRFAEIQFHGSLPVFMMASRRAISIFAWASIMTPPGQDIRRHPASLRNGWLNVAGSSTKSTKELALP